MHSVYRLLIILPIVVVSLFVFITAADLKMMGWPGWVSSFGASVGIGAGLNHLLGGHKPNK